MRGRLQALLVAVAGAGSFLFCWISAAAIALVTLRKGVGPGASLFMWALLPAGTLAYIFGDSGPVSVLSGTMVLALVLRSTVSMPLAVLASVIVGVVAGLAILGFGEEYLAQIETYFGDFLASMEQQISKDGKTVELPRPGAGQIAGMLGAGTAMSSVMCLLLGRYWQAALYNPGGFAEEFKALYYPPAVSFPLVMVALALFSQGLQYRTWGMIFFIPLTFVGLALVHAWVGRRGRGSGSLVGFYLMWLIFDPVKLVVVFIAIADSMLNFRKRWGYSPRPPGEEQGEDKDSDEDKDI